MNINLKKIFEQIKILRDPQNGCPWDKEQELTKYLKPISEEAEELVVALQSGSAPDICEEAGDLLWNLCFVIYLAEEAGVCTGEEIVNEIIAKMHRRHPHVFGDLKVANAKEAMQAFLQAKAAEKEGKRKMQKAENL